MRCVICTLFERHYHFGVAALVNSLCASGFKGTIYAGFRGPMPPWAEGGIKPQSNGHSLLEVTPDVRIIFIPVETPAHLTNYKPDFMLQVEALAAAETDAMIYCDPDLLINIEWEYITDWISCGVAVCEDINSPMPENHPTRVGWRRFFKPYGHELQYRSDSYANGGFVGMTWNYRRILPLWQEYLGHIAKLLGGYNVVGIEGGQWMKGFSGFADCFSKNRPGRLERHYGDLPRYSLQLSRPGGDGISRRAYAAPPLAGKSQAVESSVSSLRVARHSSRKGR